MGFGFSLAAFFEVIPHGILMALSTSPKEIKSSSGCNSMTGAGVVFIISSLKVFDGISSSRTK